MNTIGNKYSISDKIQLAYWLLRTKLIERRARLFRFPIVIRGRKYIDFGERLTTGTGCRFDVFGSNTNNTVVHFGKNVQLNDYVHIVAMNSVTIGDNVLMASHVFISDNSHGSYKGDENDSSPEIPPVERHYLTAPVKIEKNCWIGEGTIIMPGVTIGEGCVIGAHSIVNKSIPPYAIAAGSPAKVLKIWDAEKKRWIKI